MSESADGFALLSEDAAQASGSGRTGFPGDLFAWLGGARASILRLCPSASSSGSREKLSATPKDTPHGSVGTWKRLSGAP